MTSTEADSPGVTASLERLWLTGRDTSLQRVAVIEHAVAALLLEEDHDLDPARTAAHKLAGTLGMFGLPGGSALARDIELILSAATDADAEVHELAELAVELRRSVESSADGSDDEHDDGVDEARRNLFLIGPDTAYFESLQIGATPRQWSAQRFGDVEALPGCADAVVLFTCEPTAPSPLAVEAARRAGAALVAACGASREVALRMALADAGVDLVVSDDIGPDRALELIDDELGRRRRTATVGIVGVTHITRDDLARSLPGWEVIDVAPEELFVSELPEMLMIDADNLGVDALGLCRALNVAADTDRCSLFPIVGDDLDQDSVRTLLTTGTAGVLRRSDDTTQLAARLRSQVASATRRQPQATGAGDATADVVASRARTARRAGDHLTAVYVVPRDLERVNATEGRDAGDALLARVGATLATSLRAADVVGQWGAGHLVLLTADRLSAADRLASLIAEFERAGTPVDGALAVLGEDGDDGAALLRSISGHRRSTGDADAGPRRVLVVEDDPLIADVVTDLLESSGHRVDVVGDGQTALDALLRADARHTISLVLLDVSLPGLDGFGVLRQLQRATGAASVPIILLTARSSEEEIVKGLELGAIDHVAKPFSPQVLKSRIDRALSP